MSSRKDNAGYVPPKRPIKPPISGERGYVPPKQPVKPIVKPPTDKK